MKTIKSSIDKVNHIAIAVNNIESTKKIWQKILGCKISEVAELPDHGVKVMFINI